MKSRIIKETLNMLQCISFGLAAGAFYAIWILK